MSTITHISVCYVPGKLSRSILHSGSRPRPPPPNPMLPKPTPPSKRTDQSGYKMVLAVNDACVIQ